jgi:hypothetical protein
MNDGNNSKKSWWLTIPGILSGAAVLITAITGLIGVLYQAGVFSGKAKLRNFTVDALINCATPIQHSNLFQTGIEFRKGEPIEIKAQGEWWASKGDKDDVTRSSGEKRKGGPDGIDGHRTYETYAIDGIRVGALVGKIGIGPLFLVGSNYSAQASSSGELRLGYWDNYCDDNAGSVSVRVNGGK